MMHKSCFFIFFLLCSCLSVLSNAQEGEAAQLSDSFIPEQILIKTDRQLYISGETVWCKLYVFAAERKTLSNFSKLAYLEIISPDGIPVSRVKLALEKGHGTGSIELPNTLISGSYALRAYTKAMRNMGESTFGKASLLILHPNQTIGRATKEQLEDYKDFIPQQSSLAVTPSEQLTIDMQISQQNVAQRSMATIELSATDLSGRPAAAQFSIAVALPSPQTIAEKVLFQKKKQDSSLTSIKAPSIITYAPENTGQYLEGKVINQLTETGAAAVDVYLSFPGKTAMVYIVKTDEQGDFSFLLPELYGLRQVIIQLSPTAEESLIIELADEFEPSQVNDPKTFLLPPSWVPMATTAMVNAQIEQSYKTFEQQPTYTTPLTFGEIPFFGIPEAQYDLDDYTRFPIPEFFYEIVPEVIVKGKFGEERVKVANEWEGFSVEIPPLLLVDGVPVFDQPTFLKINNKLIASTEIVRAPFWLNGQLFDGIIQLSSFEKDARCFSLPPSAIRRSYLTLLPQREFTVPDYEERPDNPLPDFRNTLYWNPSIQTDETGKTMINFYTSDAIGEFEIRVDGVAESGLVGSLLGVISVHKISP